jgi:hypothetical protein
LHELPDFVRLVHELRGANRKVNTTVLCQPLENFNVEGYRRFIHKEHHVVLGDENLRRIFREVDKAREETGIYVSFYNQKFEQFMAEGMPIPRFFPRQMDVDLILADAGSQDAALLATEREIEDQFEHWAEKASCDQPAFIAMVTDLFLQRHFNSGVVSETMTAFPELEPALRKRLGARVEKLIDRNGPLTGTVQAPAGSFTLARFRTQPFRAGEYVYNQPQQCAGLVVKVFAAHALLHNGQLVPVSHLFQVVSQQTPEGEAAAFPLPPAPTFRMAYIRLLCQFYFQLNAWKTRICGNRKSLLLWKLSVAYRVSLTFLGLNAQPLVQAENFAENELERTATQ